eukprot:XP_003723554.1 PREDICTED: uncharacterized protein LOC100889011 [Strongylocentrotus purpuratus]
MEMLPHCPRGSRRTARCSMDQPGTPTNQTLYYTNAHPLTQDMTSPVTWVSCCKSPNRGELTHFCCCLHRRRTLLKRWSRRHREKEAARPGVIGKGDAGITQKLHICQLQPSDTTLSHPDNLSLIATSSNSNKTYTDLKDDPTLEMSTVNERLESDMVLSSGVPDKLSRSKFTSNVASTDYGGVEVETPLCPLTSQAQDAPVEGDDLTLHARLRPSFPLWTGVTIGRLVFDLVSSVSRLIPSAVQTVRRLTGGGREGRLGGRCESKLALNSAAQMTFHRWVIVLLVCIMVLPINSTAAPGLLLQGSVVEEPGNEPGYKNSFYQELPPKAEYESVIICLLAVSAFIGLIVWVLKSNFEERQQKRMRREASIRERTSSVACLKT